LVSRLALKIVVMAREQGTGKKFSANPTYFITNFSVIANKGVEWGMLSFIRLGNSWRRRV